MGHFYEAIVEPDGRIRLNTSMHLEKGLRVVVQFRNKTLILPRLASR